MGYVKWEGSLWEVIKLIEETPNYWFVLLESVKPRRRLSDGKDIYVRRTVVFPKHIITDTGEVFGVTIPKFLKDAPQEEFLAKDLFPKEGVFNDTDYEEVL